MMDFAKDVQKLWGIGPKTAACLMEHDITNIDDFRNMNAHMMALECHRPRNEISLAQSIAKKIDPEFLDEVTEGKLDLAREINGIGVDLALFLYSRGISSTGFYSERPVITSDLPTRLVNQLLRVTEMNWQEHMEQFEFIGEPAYVQVRKLACFDYRYDKVQFVWQNKLDKRLSTTVDFPHPDKRDPAIAGGYGYNIDCEDDWIWVKKGDKLVHIMFNRTLSNIIVNSPSEVGGLVAKLIAGAKIGWLWGALVAFVMWAIVFGFQRITDADFQDENSNLWVWVSKEFFDFVEQNQNKYINMLFMGLPGQMLLAPVLLKDFHDNGGYLQIGSYKFADHINQGVVGDCMLIATQH